MNKFEPYKNLNSEEVIKADQKWDAFFSLPTQNNIQATDFDQYADIEIAALQTSYNDYFKILNDLEQGKKLCDLGAGYGRGSFLSFLLGSENCFSVEVNEERHLDSLSACDQIGARPDRFICKDIQDLNLESFDNFYFYFPLNRTFQICLRNLCDLSKLKPIHIYCVEAHGETLPVLDKLECVSFEKEWELSTPRHYNFVRKYKLSPLGNSSAELFLKNMESSCHYRYRYYHLILKQEVDWIIDIKNCLLLNEGDWVIIYLPLGRKIKLTDLEVIEISLYKIDKIPSGRGKFLMNSQQYYWENNLGVVERL